MVLIAAAGAGGTCTVVLLPQVLQTSRQQSQVSWQQPIIAEIRATVNREISLRMGGASYQRPASCNLQAFCEAESLQRDDPSPPRMIDDALLASSSEWAGLIEKTGISCKHTAKAYRFHRLYLL